MKSRRGFTMVEVVVVLCVVMIVVAAGVVWWKDAHVPYPYHFSQASTSSNLSKQVSYTSESILTKFPNTITESISPNGQNKISIRSNGKNADAFKYVILSSDAANTHIRGLSGGEGVGQPQWDTITSVNWSPSNKFVYLTAGVSDGGILEVYRVDGELFKNGKSYLSATEIDSNLGASFIDEAWMSSTRLTFRTATTGPLPTTFYNGPFIFDLDKETIIKQ